MQSRNPQVTAFRFMIPMRARKSVEAFHELARPICTTFCAICDKRLYVRVDGPNLLVGRDSVEPWNLFCPKNVTARQSLALPRGNRFTVPMRFKKEMEASP